MAQQLFFDLDFSNHASGAPGSPGWRRRMALQRAVVRWLCERTPAPTGLALNVVTRVSRLRADIGAFWSRPVRNHHEEGPAQILIPERTALVQCHLEREECWPDCTKSAGILPKLKAHKDELIAVEAEIRRREPGLKDTNTLFEEYAEWRYELSNNRDYHRLKLDIERMEHGLYHGTKFERIRSAQLADRLYLAVPSGVVDPGELADGWGLLWVEPDLTVREMISPEERNCLPSNRTHLVQNIAAAATRSVLFAYGLNRATTGGLVFVKPPRAHRQPQSLTLTDADE